MNESFALTYLSVFLDELEEQLQVLDESILELENGGNSPETIQTIFRAAHTLKGSSAAMGFQSMKEVTHKVESVFELLRQNRLQTSKPLINVLFKCIDYLKAKKETLRKGDFNDEPIETLIELLNGIMNDQPAEESLVANAAAAEQAKATSVQEQALYDGWSETVLAAKAQKLTEGLHSYEISVTLASDVEMPTVKAMVILRNLGELGEVIATSPEIGMWEQEQLLTAGPIHFMLATSHGETQIVRKVEEASQIESFTVKHLQAGGGVQIGSKPSVVSVNKQTTAAAAPASNIAQQASVDQGAAGQSDAKVQIQQTVRVDVNRLEHLLNLVGELIIDNTRIREVRRRFEERFKQESETLLLGEITDHLGRVVAELQEGTMKTRMMPIEQLFNRFPRMVRDVAEQAGKEVTFHVEGKETELDRTLIEEISDPLIHIIRNAIDHGLEPPDEREKLGKNRKGNLLLRASHQENAIVITLADDGRGIDLNRIKQKAVQTGFIGAEEADSLTDKEIIALIFHSGMSTADKVTELSGRGVGMDIVRSHIEKLNGIINIETTAGEGTVFTIKLPLTLAISRSLLVQLGKHTIAIPLTNVVETFRLTPEDIQIVNSEEVCVVRGEILPLVRMHRRLGTVENDSESKGYAVMIGLAEKRVCLYVDKLVANQEIVMKSLGNYLGQVAYVSGATIMGDGRIALILDVNAVIRDSGATISKTNAGEQKATGRKVKLVTFDLEDEHYALDINQAKEIIKVPSILRMANAPAEVLGLTNLRGDLLPVIDIKSCLGMRGSEPDQQSRVIILNEDGRDIGILVDRVREVIHVTHSQIEPPPKDVTMISDQYIGGICKTDEQLVIVLKLEKMLRSRGWDTIHA
ncbi:two-component system chemotaxis sensor kinase CheA [Paenibacillus taihuensis]|uniref:Chemotaxis protein CheA n=1 Tax=Paenibacillus taihuensis TaxID=1156355 RepID=A0A3D9S771_9BACL|nr:chemotaxis protein CheW [Paenibacillus taihuensis]REE84402.1 two-component system chemotaxis sensor kinase CheA [Paenibacillus taihuensis]